MINGPTSGAIAAVSNVILQLFNLGSSAIGNGNVPTTPGDTGPVDGGAQAGLV
ncbi:hypothetical protein [Tomitella fengzijianii]|uniref:hypothetical protein n=1 Tax=Tomitella fengzijianii TaxID=2597660 RepID=UPI00131BCB92|nr:hypothetical protein [Tomitella fengzijianii]